MTQIYKYDGCASVWTALDSEYKTTSEPEVNSKKESDNKGNDKSDQSDNNREKKSF